MGVAAMEGPSPSHKVSPCFVAQLGELPVAFGPQPSLLQGSFQPSGGLPRRGASKRMVKPKGRGPTKQNLLQNSLRASWGRQEGFTPPPPCASAVLSPDLHSTSLHVLKGARAPPVGFNNPS
eukprot:CAMPEP_0117685120 /NCGR_PEP_ID=MMETSP0804-20121206/21546_1 /TAXON_ID=1074897 /ORGANISM="Tetraselmis astigmatica, Strain CCMP880" /LENGTH=121 /DNA_ID=CAMNT_0005496323 /DNA_START=68 /DNA_END=435 /DNA_ORIENTATION=-